MSASLRPWPVLSTSAPLGAADDPTVAVVDAVPASRQVGGEQLGVRPADRGVERHEALAPARHERGRGGLEALEAPPRADLPPPPRHDRGRGGLEALEAPPRADLLERVGVERRVARRVAPAQPFEPEVSAEQV